MLYKASALAIAGIWRFVMLAYFTFILLVEIYSVFRLVFFANVFTIWKSCCVWYLALLGIIYYLFLFHSYCHNIGNLISINDFGASRNLLPQMIKYNDQYMTTRFKKRGSSNSMPIFTSIINQIYYHSLKIWNIVENKEKMHIYSLHGGESESYFLA